MISAFFNTDGTAVTIFITIIGTDGRHVDPDGWPITNDPAISLSSHPSANKTVTKIDDGVFKVVWISLSPALDHGEVVYVSIDGTLYGTAWSTWISPIQVVHLPAKNSTAISIEANTQDIQSRLPSTLVGGRIDASVGSMETDVISSAALSSDAVNEIQSGLATSSEVLALNGPASIERSIDDEKEITFSWPVSGATITAEKSINNGAYSAVTGAIAFLRTDGTKHFYTLAYNANDRLTEECVVRYKLTDGTNTKYFNLQINGISPLSLDATSKNASLIPALL